MLVETYDCPESDCGGTRPSINQLVTGERNVNRVITYVFLLLEPNNFEWPKHDCCVALSLYDPLVPTA